MKTLAWAVAIVGVSASSFLAGWFVQRQQTVDAEGKLARVVEGQTTMIVGSVRRETEALRHAGEMQRLYLEAVARCGSGDRGRAGAGW